MNYEGDIPANIAKPAQRALAAAGIDKLDQLTKISEEELSKLHGMGPKALGILRDALAAKGKSFSGGEKDRPARVGNPQK